VQNQAGKDLSEILDFTNVNGILPNRFKSVSARDLDWTNILMEISRIFPLFFCMKTLRVQTRGLIGLAAELKWWIHDLGSNESTYASCEEVQAVLDRLTVR